jgi:hypothetical protein
MCSYMAVDLRLFKGRINLHNARNSSVKTYQLKNSAKARNDICKRARLRHIKLTL